jgi:hypothetical protein
MQIDIVERNEIAETLTDTFDLYAHGFILNSSTVRAGNKEYVEKKYAVEHHAFTRRVNPISPEDRHDPWVGGIQAETKKTIPHRDTEKTMRKVLVFSAP